MMSSRIAPASRPFSEAIQRRVDKIMGPGHEPLVLFTTLARDEVSNASPGADCSTGDISRCGNGK